MPPAPPASDDAPFGDYGRLEESAGASLSGTNLERAGDYNQRVVLQAIRLNGPITRAELARVTGLTPPAITNITRRLGQLGLITDAGKRRGGRGQPATRLVIDPDACQSIGVNLDRDHVAVVILDLLGRVRARASREGALGPPADTAAVVRELLGGLLAEGGYQRSQLVGLGVALPDALAQLQLPDQLPHEDWAGVDVGELLGAELAALLGEPIPVFVENDAAAAARGELQFGLGLRYSSFFYLLVTTGLGGGLVVEGEYFRGASGRSGEIGFLPIHSHHTAAKSLQEAVSLSALFAYLADHCIVVREPGELMHLDGRGAALVQQWLDMAVELLTEPLLAVSWLINPAAILLGGRLPPSLMDTLAERLAASLRMRAPDAPVLAPVHRAAMAEEAPAIGAAILPFLSELLPSRASLLKLSD